MYRGELLVRAEDEDDARRIAVQTMIISAESRLGEPTSVCPWKDPEFVSCVPVSDSSFSVDGQREVLSPPNWDVEFPDSPKYCREK